MESDLENLKHEIKQDLESDVRNVTILSTLHSFKRK